jgi:hypothetical protein
MTSSAPTASYYRCPASTPLHDVPAVPAREEFVRSVTPAESSGCAHTVTQ